MTAFSIWVFIIYRTYPYELLKNLIIELAAGTGRSGNIPSLRLVAAQELRFRMYVLYRYARSRKWSSNYNFTRSSINFWDLPQPSPQNLFTHNWSEASVFYCLYALAHLGCERAFPVDHAIFWCGSAAAKVGAPPTRSTHSLSLSLSLSLYIYIYIYIYICVCVGVCVARSSSYRLK